MKINEIRDLTTSEITRKVDDLKQELFNLRFQIATGQLDNPMRIKQVRKDIAKAKTIIREREIKAASSL
jgi:large subunit ribosomal protein L29